MTQAEITAEKIKKQMEAAGGEASVMRRIRAGDADVFTEVGQCLDSAPSTKQFRKQRVQLTATKPKANTHKRQFAPINPEAVTARAEARTQAQASAKVHLVRGDSQLGGGSVQRKHTGGKQAGAAYISPTQRLSKGDDFSKICESNYIIVDPSDKF